MLDALFRPKSVAIIGASNNPLSIGHIVLQNLLDHNFKGPIYPINPKSKYIKSFKAYASVGEMCSVLREVWGEHEAQTI